MGAVLDSADYSWDRRIVGYVMFGLLLVFFLCFDALFGIWLSKSYFDVAVLCGGQVIILFLYAVTLMMYGFLTNGSLRARSDGLEFVLPGFGEKKQFVAYGDIRELEFYISWGYRYSNKGCLIKRVGGAVTDCGVNFSDKERLSAFVARMAPILEKNGFRQAAREEERRSLIFRFLRA